MSATWTRTDAKRHPHIIFAEIVEMPWGLACAYKVLLYAAGQEFMGDKAYTRKGDAIKAAKRITPRIIDRSVYE